IAGALHAVVLLGIVLGAGVFASDIPHAVLAGILIKVGTDIIDWDYLKRLHHAPKAGVVMMFTVLFITVFVDLITAVAIGVIMASLVFMKRMTDLQLHRHHRSDRGASAKPRGSRYHGKGTRPHSAVPPGRAHEFQFRQGDVPAVGQIRSVRCVGTRSQRCPHHRLHYLTRY
ncbi:MAG: hypothetical protein KJO08_04455, partial [Gammaproteobacteria bacterium]|nr:hypothetical protein [Gammaproteobacteria bacterium]NNJ84357.1 SulP family inorganic anion transporter [Gammaproteobacteria bacterium]